MAEGRWLRWIPGRSSWAAVAGPPESEPWPRRTAGGLGRLRRWDLIAGHACRRDLSCQTQERVLHILAVFRGREEISTAEGIGQLRKVFDAELRLCGQIGLIRDEYNGDLARDALDGFDPPREDRQGLASCQVGHRKDPLRAVEERVAEQLSKSDMPDDVPDGHEDLDLRVPLRYVDPHRLLLDLRPEGPDGLVVELVEDVPSNEGGLPDASLPDEADFRFEQIGFGHRDLPRSNATFHPLGLNSS